MLNIYLEPVEKQDSTSESFKENVVPFSEIQNVGGKFSKQAVKNLRLLSLTSCVEKV